MKSSQWITGLTAAVIVAAAAWGEEPAGISGHYRYVGYTVVLPSGRILKLPDLGASEATLDVSERSITLRMTMIGGKIVEQTAKVVEWHMGPKGGHWIAQWPDMTYPVRAVIGISGKQLTSETHFDHPEDAARFGTIERALLERE